MASIFRFFSVFFIVLLILMQTKADIRRECRKQTGVAWDPLSKFKNGDFNENDPKLKCYLKCFMQKYGIFGDDSIYIDRVLRYLPYSMQKTSKNTLEKCNLIRKFL
ncbi:general odorant-binding protein 56d-like [Aphidius gifuensis]|uniref:general odorant-binding protein 56d-like n=1 Tax=Aphidius gifuensis TaxID=684658 RepID=UPI001CDBA862|nr:general odorant-binding protein 56d-like [Aphidius gifuensis]